MKIFLIFPLLTSHSTPIHRLENMLKIEKFLCYFDLLKGAFFIFLFNILVFSTFIGLLIYDILLYIDENVNVEPCEDFRIRVKRFLVENGHQELNGEKIDVEN